MFAAWIHNGDAEALKDAYDNAVGPGDEDVEQWVAIQVIGREIQQRRDPWMKGVRGLELEAARFHNVHCVLGGLLHL